MKQVSGWIAAMTWAFWGALGLAVLFHMLPRDAARFLAEVSVAPTVVILGILFIYLRRRMRRQRCCASLEEIREQSRRQMSGEGTHEIISSEKKKRTKKTGAGPLADGTCEKSSQR